MLVNRLDGVAFRLKRFYDFSYLKKYGTAFTAFDETGSGCICIGMQDEHSKFFCKIAGADTVEAVVTPEDDLSRRPACQRTEAVGRLLLRSVLYGGFCVGGRRVPV